MNCFRNETDVQNIAEKMMAAARRYGATDSAVSINSACQSLARFSLNHIIQNVEQNTLQITLAVAVGRREAALTTSVQMDDVQLDEFVKRVVETAKRYPENPEHVPPIAPLPYQKVNCFDETTMNMSPMERAGVVDRVCRRVEKAGLLSYGTLQTVSSFMAIANSHGVFAFHPETQAEFTITVRTASQTGSSRELDSHHRFDRLSIDELTDRAMDCAGRTESAVDVEPGDFTVILTPTAALNYLMPFFWVLDARKIAEGRSALTHYFGDPDPVGKQLFSPLLSVRSRLNHPEHPTRGFSAAASMDGWSGQGTVSTMFNTGLPVRDYDIINDGTLMEVFRSAYWAGQTGMDLVPFPTLLEFSGSTQSLDDLVRSTSRGLLINSFWYIRFVDMSTLLLTGLTRDGVFLVEDGQITRPVKNLRFNESPLVSMERIEALGEPERRSAWGNTILIPPMKISDMTFTMDTDAV